MKRDLKVKYSVNLCNANVINNILRLQILDLFFPKPMVNGKERIIKLVTIRLITNHS